MLLYHMTALYFLNLVLIPNSGTVPTNFGAMTLEVDLISLIESGIGWKSFSLKLAL